MRRLPTNPRSDRWFDVVLDLATRGSDRSHARTQGQVVCPLDDDLDHETTCAFGDPCPGCGAVL